MDIKDILNASCHKARCTKYNLNNKLAFTKQFEPIDNSYLLKMYFFIMS